MPTQTALNLMLALATAEFLHALSEMLSARFKASQLLAWIQGLPARRLPVDVNTRAKAYAVLATVAAVLVGGSWAVYTALALSASTAVVVTSVVVAATYAVTGIGFDGFHVTIGSVGDRIRREHPQAPTDGAS